MQVSKPTVDSVEVSDNDLVLLATIYNECLAKIDPFRYNLRFTNNYKKKTWYRDLLGLFRTINKINARPREYIQAQISEYRPPLKKSRRVPTIKMMSSEEGIKRYYSYLDKHGRIPSNVVVVKANTSEFADSIMHKLMKSFHIEKEQDFFKDPFLIKQLPRAFVTSHPAYKELCAEHFYEKTYGLHGIELIS